jgi:hypothetical protein
MSKPNKKLSRTEPTETPSSVAPAGTPTAASAPEVPLPQAAVQIEPAVGESLPIVTLSPPVVTRTSGAGWFIPQQQASGFGTKGN